MALSEIRGCLNSTTDATQLLSIRNPSFLAI